MIDDNQDDDRKVPAKIDDSKSSPSGSYKDDTEQNEAADSQSKGEKRAAAGAAVKEGRKKRRNKKREQEPDYPVQPNIIQIVKKPKTHVNHTYRDFSNMPDQGDFHMPQHVGDMTFTQKVYHLLSEENDFARSAISWFPHGRAFKVHDPAFLENSGVLTSYFGHNRCAKLLKQLTNHGFKAITNGKDAGGYYNEFFLRGLPHLLKYSPEPEERRKILPDPENEPDFYRVSELFPLPGDKKDPREEARAALAARGIVISDDNLTTTASSNSSDTDVSTLINTLANFSQQQGMGQQNVLLSAQKQQNVGQEAIDTSNQTILGATQAGQVAQAQTGKPQQEQIDNQLHRALLAAALGQIAQLQSNQPQQPQQHQPPSLPPPTNAQPQQLQQQPPPLPPTIPQQNNFQQMAMQLQQLLPGTASMQQGNQIAENQSSHNQQQIMLGNLLNALLQQQQQNQANQSQNGN